VALSCESLHTKEWLYLPRTGRHTQRSSSQRNPSPNNRINEKAIRFAAKHRYHYTTKTRPRLVLLIVILAVIAVIAHALGSCSSREPVTQTASYNTASEQLYQSPYDWNNLSLDDKGLYEYRSGLATLSRVGVDVSEHQHEIDWTQVHDYGIQFAYIRVGYRSTDTGTIVKDAYFDENFANARAAGLDVGVYFYSQATTTDEAVQEADYVVSQLDNADIAYPIAFDLEPTNGAQNRASNLTQDQYTQIMKAFADEVNQRGYQATVYGNASDLGNYDLSSLSNYPLWVASYGAVPQTNFDFTMWQYSNNGNLPGIDTAVDMDLDLTQAYQRARG